MTDVGTPIERLRARIERLGAPLCLGIDPHPQALPDDLPRDVRGVERFARGLVEAAASYAAAIKVNVAFFEAFGSAGWAALERLREDVPRDHVLIADAKRGDIDTSAERSAAALFGHLDADGVTVSPYLGADGVEPFLAFPDRIVYVLARTSNPSAPDLQDLPSGEPPEPLHHRVASWVTATWPEARVGLVVGATVAAELASLRTAFPDPGFLVPGVGAQGGDLATAVRACHGAAAPGLVNVSRGIASASLDEDWPRAAARAAEAWGARMAEAGGTLAP